VVVVAIAAVPAAIKELAMNELNNDDKSIPLISDEIIGYVKDLNGDQLKLVKNEGKYFLLGHGRRFPVTKVPDNLDKLINGDVVTSISLHDQRPFLDSMSISYGNGNAGWGGDVKEKMENWWGPRAYMLQKILDQESVASIDIQLDVIGGEAFLLIDGMHKPIDMGPNVPADGSYLIRNLRPVNTVRSDGKLNVPVTIPEYTYTLDPNQP